MLFGNVILFLEFSSVFAQRAFHKQNLISIVVDLNQGEYRGSNTITMLKTIQTKIIISVLSFISVTNDFFSLFANSNSAISQRSNAIFTFAFNNIFIHHTNTSSASNIQKLTPTSTSQNVFTEFEITLLSFLHYIIIFCVILSLVAEAMY